MVEYYSQNVVVAANTAIPFNNVSLQEGNYVTKSGTSTIQFNHCGVYRLDCHGSVSLTNTTSTTGTGDSAATSSASGVIAIELQKESVLQPQTICQISASGSNVTPFAFSTLVQISSNNTSCCCSAPTEVNIINTGAAATFAIVDVAVTKVC